MIDSPTNKAFKDARGSLMAKYPGSDININLDGETKETASTTGSGSFEPALSFKVPKLTMFSDEAPKETQSKGGIVKKVEAKEDKLRGGTSDDKTIEQIAKKHDKKGYYDIKDMVSFLKKQLQIGKKVESEHTNDESIAIEIAMDHLMEDPNYYTKLSKIEKGEFKEMTGSASSGSYVGASFLAKSQNKKDWRGASKPLYKGGKFVRVKKKCKTFPYCNQGDIKALDLWEDDKLKEAIKNVAKSKNIHENVVRAIVLHEIEEQLFTK